MLQILSRIIVVLIVSQSSADAQNEANHLLRDGMCNANNPCDPPACCSKFGNCGFSSEHCGNGCQSECSSQPPVTQCSSSKPCSPTACCSKFGVCGFTTTHCGDGCQSGCSSKPPPTECSATKPCKVKACCSQFGSCGYGPKFCGSGCQNQCDSKPECGQYSDKGACPLHVCCSKFGFCGLTSGFCQNGCQRDCNSPGKPACGVQTSSLHIGYYTSWSSTRKCEARKPSDINIKEYTHLNYAFGLVSGGQMIDTPGGAKLIREMIDLKKKKIGLKILVSIGGWSFNDEGPSRYEFHNIARTANSRSTFITSVISFLRKNSFDGIDIDWEYPTAVDRGGSPEDTKNYVSLVREMRAAFGSQYLITIAAPASYWYLRNFEIGEMSKHLDWINFMTYDFHGLWNKDSLEFGKKLRSHTDIRDIEAGLDLLFRDGVKPDKIVIGLGFYGRSYELANTNCREIEKCEFSAAGKPGRCTAEPGILALYEIEDIIKQYSLTPKFDPKSQSQVLSWDNQWVTYDDEKTLNTRKNLAKKYCLRGTMVWAVDLGKKTKISKGIKSWRECIEEAKCCNRVSIFCTMCSTLPNPQGCIRIESGLKAGSYSESEDVTYVYSRWMRELPDEIKLSEMSIPCTHDSAAKTSSILQIPRYTQTQSLTISKQLEAGIRGLDIRCRVSGDKLAIHHGPIYLHLNFDDVMRMVTRFLANNPSETVLMRIKEDHTRDSDSKKTFADILQSYIDNYSDYFWKSTNLPTLGEVRGKIVILDQIPNSPGFGPPWNSFKIQDKYELPIGFGDLSSPEEGIKWKIKFVKEFFEETNSGDKNMAYLNFFNVNSIRTSPSNFAGGTDVFGNHVKQGGVNKRAVHFLNPTVDGSIDRAGWVFMDYPGPGLIYTIIIRNSGTASE